MTYSIAFHADTAADYNEAYRWYEEQQEGLGERFLTAIADTIQRIVVSPEIFSVKSRPGYHEALVRHFPYTIVYRIDKKHTSVFICSVHHQRKHPRKKFRK